MADRVTLLDRQHGPTSGWLTTSVGIFWAALFVLCALRLQEATVGVWWVRVRFWVQEQTMRTLESGALTKKSHVLLMCFISDRMLYALVRVSRLKERRRLYNLLLIRMKNQRTWMLFKVSGWLQLRSKWWRLQAGKRGKVFHLYGDHEWGCWSPTTQQLYTTV